MAKSLDSFVGLYPLQKTLRFELIPQGKTAENLQKTDFFEKDKERADDYKLVKPLIDSFHKQFINDVLGRSSLDWEPLAKSMMDYRQTKEDKYNKEMKKEQEKMRKALVKLFESDERYKNLFSAKLFTELLVPDIEQNGSAESKAALASFNRFYVYFTGFHETRKNIYSSEEKATAIAYRVVHENFPKYLRNKELYEKIKKEMPEVIKSAEAELADYHISYNETFSIENYNKVLQQSGIENYNRAIGGVSLESGEKKRGLNEFINLELQRINSSEKIRLVPLYKQILSDKESLSFIPQSFNDRAEIITSMLGYYEVQNNNSVFHRIKNLFENISNFDHSSIYINNAGVTKVSQVVTGNWGDLGGLLQIFKADELGDPHLEKNQKKVDKWISSKEFQLDTVESALKLGNNEGILTYCQQIKISVDIVESSIEKMNVNAFSSLNDEDFTKTIKEILDQTLDLLHILKPFNIPKDMPRDGLFYDEYDDVVDSLSAIIPLYNRIRNFLTKKKLNTSKIKLNFGNPTLADGWDLNKEKDNTSIILRKDGKYYLGIMNPKDRTDFSKLSKETGIEYYQKMTYKLLSKPEANLPRVFILAKKNIEYFAPSEYIISGYKAGKHKTGDSFDLKFCHDLIDFFKASIEKHPEWNNFNFNFSPTSSYENISQFYIEVEKQGYKISFSNISESTINKMVEAGKLFLFQIYNKDFSSFSTGNKNMHTLYWINAFSDENLKNITIKLNGEAELFFREKSNIKETVHKKGEILVSKRDTEKRPMPDNVYKELFEYLNKRRDSISSESERYLDMVKTSVATHEIVKDRRYHQDKMYFHVPLTLNFNSYGKENVNQIATEYIVNNKDIHIIGIDRGERNLIYISVINRNGEIILQKSFNVINEYDYQMKLDQREIGRGEARKSWTDIEKISDLKEGYLSAVIYEISKLIVEYNAVVVLEDLNFGFKRGRFKIEKQVYQKFEKMLIEKLNYLVFKNLDADSTGGPLRGYQLTAPFEGFNKLGKRSGMLFYVPASYTSKVDPTTGFVNLFNWSAIKTVSDRKEFLSNMESIVFDKNENMFAFTFDFVNFKTSRTGKRTKWTSYSVGTWAIYNRKDGTYRNVTPTEEIISALQQNNIDYNDGKNILYAILDKNNPKLVEAIFYSFKTSISLRNTYKSLDEIVSPVKNNDGGFFKSSMDNKQMPIDADANGAYHIALKGLMAIELLEQDYDPDQKKTANPPNIDINAWLDYIQSRHQ